MPDGDAVCGSARSRSARSHARARNTRIFNSTARVKGGWPPGRFFCGGLLFFTVQKNQKNRGSVQKLFRSRGLDTWSWETSFVGFERRASDSSFRLGFSHRAATGRFCGFALDTDVRAENRPVLAVRLGVKLRPASTNCARVEMNWRCFSLRLFLLAAAVSACEAPVRAGIQQRAADVQPTFADGAQSHGTASRFADRRESNVRVADLCSGAARVGTAV